MSSSSSGSDNESLALMDSDGETYYKESANEKRLRLAKQYLSSIEQEYAIDGGDAKEIDKENIAARLKQDSLRETGALFQHIASNVVDASTLSIVEYWKAHSASITSLAVCNDFLFSAAKDGSIVKWNWKKGCKTLTLPPKHTGDITCLAASHNGSLLASGSTDKTISIWDVESGQCLTIFKQHRDTVTSLAFSKSQLQLYSGSLDRAVKVWNVSNSDMGYIETLFGHQEGVAAVDALYKERVMSVGLRDRSARLWKIIEESQLVYRADVDRSGGSLENIKMINEDYFVTGSDIGVLDLWHAGKKKSIHSIAAHSEPILSMATVPNSDLLATGSLDGSVHLWKVDIQATTPMMEHLGTISIPGCINNLAFTNDCKYLFAAVSKEPRLGRWTVVGNAKPGIYKISLQ